MPATQSIAGPRNNDAAGRALRLDGGRDPARGARVTEAIAAHVGGLTGAPVFRPVPGGHANRPWHAPLPERGRGIDDVIDAFLRDVSCTINPRARRENIDRLVGAVHHALAGILSEVE